MQQDEPRWGEAPDGDLIAELLVDRFPIEKGDRLHVEVDEEGRALALRLTAGRHVYRIRAEYLRGAGDRDPWLILVDALDNLFGTLIESDRAYRELPAGEDIEFEGAALRVIVEHELPELDKIAQQILKKNGDPKAE